MTEIGLSLSGGGYRAAMFHLGAIDYMRRLKYSDGSSFLDDVNTISTISGGSITGLWYIMHYLKGVDIEDSINELYRILVSVELPAEALKELSESGGNKTSLIRIMVELYDKYFFHGETFDLILRNIDSQHIHHFSANGTDFGTGLPFRFQAARKIQNALPQYSRGFIGNKCHYLSWEIAGKIKLSEILAVSSCFPGGFEPMRFPEDFSFSKKQENQTFLHELESYDLMDGGIVDNQGIEPLLLANKQLSYDHPIAKGKDDYACFDLLIISDVASPEIPQSSTYKLSHFNKVTLGSIKKTISICLFMFLASFGGSMCIGKPFLTGVFLTLFVVSSLLSFVLFKIENLIQDKLQKLPFKINFQGIKNISLYQILTLIITRISSLNTLAKSIFMKPIRQMRYNAVYGNVIWKNRCIANNLRELSSKGSWKWKKGFSEYLIPSQQMKENSDKANSFGTTLWFSENDKKENIPEALFCAGQYTICMNLLEYFEKIKKDNTNTGAAHEKMLTLEKKLLHDWNLFKQNPRVYHL